MAINQTLQMLVQEWAKNAVKAQLLFGTVTAIRPFALKIDQKALPLSQENLIFTEAVTKKEIVVGDKCVILNLGNAWLVLDRLGAM